ncbi:MAG TPA: hypothetical protein VMY76_00715 [Gemmatimonadales bacterium]|nr:hypothetical protein [Gemmatimonadales bacterium]
MASTASLRKMLGLPEEDESSVPPPGYLASVGVRKMDPAVVNQPRGYEPTLPIPPAATPSGEEMHAPPSFQTERMRPEEVEAALARAPKTAPVTAGRATPGLSPVQGKAGLGTSPRSSAAGSLAGLGKAAPMPAAAQDGVRGMLAELRQNPVAAQLTEQPAQGGNPTTVNGMVGKMVAGAGLAPGSGAPPPTPSIVDMARRLLEARQASGNRLIAGMAQAGATAIGKGDAPGLRQLAANAEVPTQEAEKDEARFERRTERDARTKAAVEAAKRALSEKAAAREDQQAFRADQAQRDRDLKAALAKISAGNRTDRDESGLRKELLGNKTTKDTLEVSAAYRKVHAAASEPSAAGDMSIIYGYMKMLDPGSTVREGEFANAQNAAGVPDQIRNAFNRVLNGERLGPAQRQDFLNQAAKTYRAQVEQYQALENSYRDLASGRGFDPGRVAIPMGIQAPPATSAPSAATAATVRVRRKSDGKIRELAADAAKQVLADPNYEAAP